MNNLEQALSEIIGLPIQIRKVNSAITEYPNELPKISFDIECVPDLLEDDDIPFCDMDCDDCCCDFLDESDIEDEYPNFWGIPYITRVIFNPPATIVFWDDGTKTVVKCMEGQPFEKYAGFSAACMKKMFGSTSRAKAIMEECDEDAQSKHQFKDNKSKTKAISVEDLINAFTQSLIDVAKDKKDPNPVDPEAAGGDAE